MTARTNDAQEILKRGLIVSCQAEEGSPFNAPGFIAAFSKAAELGGAVGVRVRDPENVRAVAAATHLPIIGLTKGKFPSGAVLITPTLGDAVKLAASGASIVALDATSRRRPGGLTGTEFIRAVRSAVDCMILADCSTAEEGVAAADEGADFIATTLSGYIDPSQSPPAEPDYALIRALASRTPAPVIAEGRIWSPDQAAQAVACGAYAVCVGTAITRPVDIIRRFALVLRSPAPPL